MNELCVSDITQSYFVLFPDFSFGCKNELFKETDNATYNLNPTQLEVLLVPMESEFACYVDLVHYKDSHYTYECV
jgi:hypothetical protein